MSKRIETQDEMNSLPEGVFIYMQVGKFDEQKIVGKMRRSRRKGRATGMEVLSDNGIENWFRIDIRTYPKGESPYYLMTDDEAMIWKLEN